MPTNVGALSMTRLRWCGLSRPGDRSGCGDTAGEAPCSASALVDLWASGLSPAYPIPVPDRVTPTYERAQPPERGRGPAADRDQDRQARHPGRDPGRGGAALPLRSPRRAAGPRRRTAGHRARPRREADRGWGVRASARAGRGETFQAGAEVTARTLE